MFSLRKETDYAIQFLKLLTKNSRTATSLNEVSEKTGLSFLFLQKIARKLRLAGIIKAELGVEGGYRLKIPAKKITLKKVISVIEGGCLLWSCCEKGECKRLEKCAINKKVRKINSKILKIFEETKLSDL